MGVLQTVTIFIKYITNITSIFTSSFFTSDGILTSRTFLGHRGLVAVHTVEVILMSSKSSTSQWLLAGVAHKAFRVPGLILIVDPTRGDGLQDGKHKFYSVNHKSVIKYSNEIYFSFYY